LATSYYTVLQKKSNIRKILIIAPHFPPSNLAGVHRTRLFAQHLPSFGWEPVILSVHEKYYEEVLDWNLVKLLPPGLRIEKVKAMKVTTPRLVGDIGLRAFFQLYKKAKNLIKNEKIDFLYIPIPSFYVALLGRWLHATTNIKYGIDYIDPWVHEFAGSEKLFSRHWFSTKLSKILEPIALKKAALVTGVGEGYFKGVIERNPLLSRNCYFKAMPYGGEINDHTLVDELMLKPYLLKKKEDKIQLVYGGAMLPKAFTVIEKIFLAISMDREIFRDLELHFIGTGSSPGNPKGYNIRPIAEKYGLWQTIIFEYPARIPYLDILVHLSSASGVFIFGSTEFHYTPSKVYQAVLSKKAVWAILHTQSSACDVLRAAGAGAVLDFNGEGGLDTIVDNLASSYQDYKILLRDFNPAGINLSEFQRYSAKNVTGSLAQALDSIFSTEQQAI